MGGRGQSGFAAAGLRHEVTVRLTAGKKQPDAWIAAVRLEFADREPLVIRTGPEWKDAADVGPYGMKPWGEVGLMQDHALPARHLRKEFEVAKQPARATVSVSGLGLYELYLNGGKVGDHVLSPNLTEYGKRAFYVTYDVTRQLRTGKNALGLVLGNGRYHAPRATTDKVGSDYGSPKALLQLEVEYEDGSTSQVVTDDTWRLTTEGPIRANNEFDGEEFDARRELTGWSLPGFDDTRWQAAQVVASPGGVIAAQMMEPLKVTETLHPVKVTR
ncbi:MAG: alpha-L-rhamnosidase N-terminal domain-containing protein, partial [Acidobacteria bacterium]|nr:alpha-L-rhamnosidase N-terminal domain-containing protein [Acidobacteriota bacterium]